uniref:Uncharacterized protein n=1 Tax=Tanacetum cinerariifolium TaxID=118510 RepID=A0A6L2LFJ7_TANCI|nr:hypothetical protein [Tanacetum cinerariifolium]
MNPGNLCSAVILIDHILQIQKIDDIVIGGVVLSYPPVVAFATTNSGGIACYVVAMITSFILVIGGVVLSYPPVVAFATTNSGGIACYVVAMITSFIRKF